MPKTLPPKLRAWSAAMKQLRIKPPIKKGTDNYKKAKELAESLFQQYVNKHSK